MVRDAILHCGRKEVTDYRVVSAERVQSWGCHENSDENLGGLELIG
jgi:hypothetical protein